MAQREEEIRKIVEELQGELARLGPLDAASREKVDALTTKLKQYTEQQQSEESLSDSLTAFEVSHPKVTALIDRIMTMLSNMGI